MALTDTRNPHDRLPKRQKGLGKSSSDIHALRRMTQPSEKEQRELRQQLQQETAEDIKMQLSSVPETPLKKQLTAILTMILVMLTEYERLRQEAEKMLELVKEHEAFEMNEEKKNDDGWWGGGWGRGGFVEEPPVPVEEEPVANDNEVDIVKLRSRYDRLVKDRDELRNQLNQLCNTVRTKQNDMYLRTVNRTDDYLRALDQRNNSILRAANLLMQLPAGAPGALSEREREELQESMARVHQDQVNRAVDTLKVALNTWIDLPEESRRLFSPAEQARMEDALGRAYEGLDRGSNRGLIEAASIMLEYTQRFPLEPATIVTPGGPEAAPAPVKLKTILNSESKRDDLRAAIGLAEQEQTQQEMVQQREQIQQGQERAESGVEAREQQMETPRESSDALQESMRAQREVEEAQNQRREVQRGSAQLQVQQMSAPAQVAGGSQPPPDDRPSSPKLPVQDAEPKKPPRKFQTQTEKTAEIIKMNVDLSDKGLAAIMEARKAIMTDLMGDKLSRPLKKADINIQLSFLKSTSVTDLSNLQSKSSSEIERAQSLLDQVKESLKDITVQQKKIDKITDIFKREEPQHRVELARDEREMRDKESVLIVKDKQLQDISSQIELISSRPAVTASASAGVMRAHGPIMQQHVEQDGKHTNLVSEHQLEEVATKSSDTVNTSDELHDNKLTSEGIGEANVSGGEESSQSPSSDNDEDAPTL